ncbi:MAG: PAAR domain-containing protein [Lysobacter sp.]
MVGDTTSSGGQVITGSPFTDIDGKPVARINDKATCPKHQGTFPIVDGDPTTIIDGEAVALHGSSLACGCRVLAVQQVRVLLDAGGGGGGGSSGVSGGPKAAAADPGAMAGPIASLAFDEQIRFVGPTGVPLSNLGYRLHLADGSTAEGVTDADGRTERVATVQAVGFYSAELLPPAGAQGCCAASALPAQSVPVALNGAATNASAVGSSTHKVATKDEDRDLTSGEVAMLSQVFGSSVDYSAVKLHNHGYWMLFGFQPDNTATAPNGEIYMPADLFSPDFSRELNERQHLLVHEITHVWQYQLGYPVKRVRAPRPNMSYEYLFTQGRKLCDYNMEAQGNLIADYFLVKFRNDPLNISEFRYSRMPGLMAEYERALSDFIADPSNPENLPKVTE